MRMTQHAGQPVATTPAAVNRAPSDLQRLVGYLNGRFQKRREEISELVARCETLASKQDQVVLGFRAVEFRRELDSWIALAQELRAKALDTAADAANQTHADEAAKRGLKRPSAKLVEAHAEAKVAEYTRVVDVLVAERYALQQIISLTQTVLRAVRDEEFGDELEHAYDAPDELFDAPLGTVTRALERR